MKLIKINKDVFLNMEQIVMITVLEKLNRNKFTVEFTDQSGVGHILDIDRDTLDWLESECIDIATRNVKTERDTDQTNPPRDKDREHRDEDM